LLLVLKSTKQELSAKAYCVVNPTLLPISLILVYFSEIKEMTGFELAALSFLLTKKVLRLGVLLLFNNVVYWIYNRIM
jgi:hypothetical protein